MNSKTKGFASALGAALVTFAAPAVALAETPSGPDILLPKPAEFVPALIAFLIIWAVLAKLAWPSILKMMEQRQQKIQDDLDSAAKSKADAAREVKDLEARIAASHKDAEAIVAKAKREAEEERSRILAKAQREAADIVAKSRGAVQSERKKAMIELSSSVVDLSVEIASKIIGNELSEESQRKLAEKYLDEIGASDER
jgi:F-type H+-transporting ATPase subunit b